MNQFKLLLLIIFSSLFSKSAAAQNVIINVLTQHSGIVQKDSTVFFEVTINNNDAVSFIGIYKLKAQITVPSSIVSIPLKGHNLPTGWEIISNTGNSITISNGKDMIAANDSRTLLIAVKGEEIGGPAILSGQLSFSNGNAPGNEPGALKGDNPTDNYSTSSCKVISNVNK